MLDYSFFCEVFKIMSFWLLLLVLLIFIYSFDLYWKKLAERIGVSKLDAAREAYGFIFWGSEPQDYKPWMWLKLLRNFLIILILLIILLSAVPASMPC